MKLNCPNCSTELKVTVEPTVRPAGPARQTATDVTPLTDKALADVWQFMKERPGKHVSREMYDDYLRWTDMARPLTQNAFGRAVKANGGAPWRSSVARGYIVPPMEETKPASMSPERRERFEAAHQRQAVQEHRGGAPAIQPLLDRVNDPIVLPLALDGDGPA